MPQHQARQPHETVPAASGGPTVFWVEEGDNVIALMGTKVPEGQ